ncbi:MAG: GGDEF domain-containing protein, partial [Comamonadaceae bacterium]|nr:GGDEF domain-containing protein [Comamonadaceae bacterium]
MNLVDPRATTPAELAKAALKRLALARQAPTPENYARAWAEETGGASPARADDAAASRELEAQGQAWASLTERLVAGLERGGRQWTAARRKQSLQRVLQTSRNDPARLLQRLQPLVQAWHGDHALDAPELAESIEASGAADDAAAPARAADA